MKVFRTDEIGMYFGVRDALHLAQEATDPAQITIHERQRLTAGNKELNEQTCPLVRRVHEAALELQAEGRHVLLIGQAGHVEAQGGRAATKCELPLGWQWSAPVGHYILVEKTSFYELAVQGIVEGLDSYDFIGRASEVRCYESRQLGIVSQATMPPDVVTEVCSHIQLHNPLADIRLIDTVCDPTKRRQRAMFELRSRIDAVVVVGGRNSNNTCRLVQLCHEHLTPAVRVECAEELEPEWFDGVNVVGLIACTSTFDVAVGDVHRALEQIVLNQQQRGNV